MQYQPQPQPERIPELSSAANLFHAIAHPLRMDIIEAIGTDGGMNVGELAEHFGIDQSTISTHLRLLFRAGLVTRRREGGFNYYRAAPERLAAVATAAEKLADVEQE